jgi:hypothetical protein
VGAFAFCVAFPSRIIAMSLHECGIRTAENPQNLAPFRFPIPQALRGIFVEAALEQSPPSRVESLPPMNPWCQKSEENPKVGGSGVRSTPGPF